MVFSLHHFPNVLKLLLIIFILWWQLTFWINLKDMGFQFMQQIRNLKCQNESNIWIMLIIYLKSTVLNEEFWLWKLTRRKFVSFWFFLFVLKTYHDKRPNNMLSLMLDLAYKTLRLTPHTLGESRVLQLLKSMTKSLLPMFLQCYQHLHFTKYLCKCFIYMTLLVTIMFSASRNNMLILPLTYGHLLA